MEGLRKQKSLAVEMKNSRLPRRFEEFGELLHEAWIFKKKMSPKISNPAIDAFYEEARKPGGRCRRGPLHQRQLAQCD